MKIFLNKAERIKYLGFNDLYASLVGIPLLSLVAFLIFSAGKEGLGTFGLLICFLVGMLHTVVYWVINRFLVLRLRKWMPKETQTFQRIGLMIAFAFLSVLILEACSDVIVAALFPGLLEMGWNESAPVFGFVVAFTLCLLVLAMYESAYFFVKYRNSLLEQERLAKENMQAQLSVLKQQMNPHFLFNSLNTLINIIPEDTEKATLFTQRLAAVYRRILEYRHKEVISLNDELLALKDYIFLMQTRFEDKLQVKWCLSARTQVQCDNKPMPAEIPPHLRFHRIVPLSVQLLVENAIKHNVVSGDTPLTIEITLDEASVTVSNQLNLRDRRLGSTGWGHENLRKRYAAVTDQAVVIEQTAETFSVSVPVLEPVMAERSVNYLRS